MTDKPVSTLPILALIGCGKMGGAMLQGWLAENIASHIYVLDPAGPSQDFKSYLNKKITWFEDTEEFLKAKFSADIFILAVKPQIMKDVCIGIKNKVPREALILSIAAGQTISSFENYFSDAQPIIRSMPNTPAAIGKGMTVAVGNRNINEPHKTITDMMLSTVGLVEWAEDEELLNAVTAVSGSGPAYVFLMIEAMAEAGEKAGLSKDFSMRLARQTIIGSAALAEQQPDIPASTLRKNVTSPGGTTEAALKVLTKDNALLSLMTDAVKAATQRGKELAKS